MIYHCCDDLRRIEVAKSTLNAIDYLEVLDSAAPQGSPPRRTLLVRLLKSAGLDRDNVRIEGGERVRNVAIEWAGAASGLLPQASPAEIALFNTLVEPENVLVVRVDREGDFSLYRLILVKNQISDEPPPGFDPQLSAIEFSFKVECDSQFDCRPTRSCPDEMVPEPPIDYLAKDYLSFRRLALDRMSQLAPEWGDRSVADEGVALVELIAYVADQLSYQQDAVATEAYLNTARLRTSLRRHALLVDYHVHNGCNARAWVHVVARAATVNLPKKGTLFYTRMEGRPGRIDPSEHAEVRRARPTVFEPLHDAVLHEAHNEIQLYTWGDERCCLPAGATRATLAGHLPDLRKGDVLLFEEVKGPSTGGPGDADPRHRHLVRLTGVANTVAGGSAELTDPLTGAAITEVEWDPADAPAFPICVSSVTDREHGGKPLAGVSVARGNMVLADHGETMPKTDLSTVPPPRLFYRADRDSGQCNQASREPIPPRYAPRLPEVPLTFAGTVRKVSVVDGERTVKDIPFDSDRPVAEAMTWEMEHALPQIWPESELDGATEPWIPRRDLLNSSADDRHFVVEVEHDGTARLRFGDGVHGLRPREHTNFATSYRLGNGRVGNVGAESLRHVETIADVMSARNPLPAQGGRDVEDAASVRRRAPQAFRRQERAVTTQDYELVTEGSLGVQRAAATLRWTGSWHTMFIAVDRTAGETMTEDFENSLTERVDRYRMAGQDTEFNDPIPVSLEIELQVCVKSGYLRSDVRVGIIRELGTDVLPDGRQGLFHPDRLSFGQVVFLSPIYAAARRVPGVESVKVSRFERQGETDLKYLNDGFMALGRLEVPRLENDPNFPEHGVLEMTLFGGK